MRSRLLAGAGVIVLVSTMLAADPARAWGSYVANVLFWLAICAGAVTFSAALTLTSAEWADRLRPIAESFLRPLQLVALSALAVPLGAASLYPWAATPIPGLETWLWPPAVLARDLVALGALVLAARTFVGSVGPRRAASAFGLALLYAVACTVLAWDLIMTLEPGWTNTLFGAYYFVGGFHGGLAAVGVRATWRRALESPAAHDLGTLMFGGAMVWGYFLWSQYLVFWYGNLPHETGFWLRRVEGTWGTLGLVVVGSTFALPFTVLLSARAKRSAATLSRVAILLLAGLWAEKLLLLGPAARSAPAWPIAGVELLVGVGFGLLVLAALPHAERARGLVPRARSGSPVRDGRVSRPS